MVNTTTNLKVIEERFGLNHKILNNEVAYCCPFCLKRRGKADNDYKFSVNLITLKGHCFKCNVKLRLKSDLMNVSTSGVFTDLVGMFGEDDEEIEDDENMFFVPDIPIQKGTCAYQYCVDRGIDDDKINFYELKMGVGEYLGRIIIPNEYNDGWVDMFQGRSYIGKDPKYKNPYGVDKSKIVFNLHRIPENADSMVICEGAITAIMAGKNAVATYGCHPSENQIEQIISKHCKEYICCLDNDEAGRPGNDELARTLIRKAKGSRVTIVYMPEGKDAADMGTTEFVKYVRLNKMPYMGKFAKLF